LMPVLTPQQLMLVLSGMPETPATEQTPAMPAIPGLITLCGDGMEKGGNFRVPRGITFHDLAALCGGFPQDKVIIKNSLLSGHHISGALDDSTIAILAAENKPKSRSACISCGECARVCPAKIYPAEILLGPSEALYKKCVSCGACEYICPSGIPLMNMIKSKEGKQLEQQ